MNIALMSLFFQLCPLKTLVGLIFKRNKNLSEYSINQGVDGSKTFQAMNNASIILGFQLVACLRMKIGKN